MPLKLGLVGFGSAARDAHVPAISALGTERATIIGIVERAPERAEIAHSLGVTVVDTLDALLALDPDVAVVATPPSDHLRSTLAALGAGIDVVCEKPLGLHAADAAELDAALTTGSAAVVSVHQYRYASAWGVIERAVAAARSHQSRWTLEVSVERPGTDPRSAGSWRTRAATEGGIIGDHIVHYVALAHTLAPDVMVGDVDRGYADGHERAQVRLSGSGCEMVLRASYAEAVRSNAIRLRAPGICLDIEWHNGRLVISRSGVAGTPMRAPALSDRDVVNGLYLPLYADLAGNLQAPVWRQQRTSETLAVARLLADALSRRPTIAMSTVQPAMPSPSRDQAAQAS